MELLGVEQPTSFDYRWMSSGFWQGRCPANAGACASHGEPYTRLLPDMHEIVHMVAYQLPNFGCASLLEEAEYDDYPPCSAQQLRARRWECGGEPDFVAAADNALFELTAGCDEPTVINANKPGDRGDAMLTRLLYFPTDTWVQVITYAAHDVTYAIQQCAPCSERPQVVRDLNHRRGNHVLRAGLHVAIVFFDKRDTVNFRLRVMDEY